MVNEPENTATAGAQNVGPSSQNETAAPPDASTQTGSLPDAQLAPEQAQEPTDNRERSAEGRRRRQREIDGLFAEVKGLRDQNALLLEMISAVGQGVTDNPEVAEQMQTRMKEYQESAARNEIVTEAEQLRDYVSGLEGDAYKDIQSQFNRAYDAGNLTRIREIARDAEKVEARVEERGSLDSRIQKAKEDAISEYKKELAEKGDVYNLTPAPSGGTPQVSYQSKMNELATKLEWSEQDMKDYRQLTASG